MDVRSALHDPKLLGASPAFADREPWAAWRGFLGALYGLPLPPEEERAFLKATSLPHYDPPEGGWREAAAIVGRQAGKTRAAAALVTLEAALATPPEDGEVYALLLAQDHRSAIRTAFSYIRAQFQASPMLTRMVVAETRDTLELSNGVRVAAYPCRPASIRGLRAIVAVLDELAYYISTDARPVDTEVLRAVRPTLATTGGRLVILSSPYGQSGALWELHRRCHGQEDASTLVWQADAPTMNPTLPHDYLERMRQDDPEAHRSEVLGEFRAGLSTLLDPDALDACVGEHRELPPAAGVEYAAFVDPSGGRRDAFTCGIGHGEDERIIVDAARAWEPPLNPAGAVEECAALLARYGVTRVTGDRYAGEWPREQFRRHGVEYAVAAKPKSELYLSLLPRINAGEVLLPDDRALLRELRGLERRRGPSGKDRVDHRPGARDDRANAAAGLVVLLGEETGPDLELINDVYAPPPLEALDKDHPLRRKADAERHAERVRRAGGVYTPGFPD